MQQKIKFLSLAAASLIAMTAGAYAQSYDAYGNQVGLGPKTIRASKAAPPRGDVPSGAGRAGMGHMDTMAATIRRRGSTQGDVGP